MRCWAGSAFSWKEGRNTFGFSLVCPQWFPLSSQHNWGGLRTLHPLLCCSPHISDRVCMDLGDSGAQIGGRRSPAGGRGKTEISWREWQSGARAQEGACFLLSTGRRRGSAATPTNPCEGPILVGTDPPALRSEWMRAFCSQYFPSLQTASWALRCVEHRARSFGRTRPEGRPVLCIWAL